jgi:hypothetical protein
MALVPFAICTLFGGYFLYSGIIDKPPFEFMQADEGWNDSRFPNKYWASGTGIFFIGLGIYLLIAL